MLNLILISVLNSHQSTNHILLYKRTLCSDEASGLEILAGLVQSFIESFPPYFSHLSLQYQWLLHWFFCR